MRPRTRLMMKSCTSSTSGNCAATAFSRCSSSASLDDFFRLFDGRRLALDVCEDVGNLRDVAAHVGFEFGDLIMRVFERHALVEFDVLFDVKVAGEILHADVVHVEIVVRRDGADAVEDVFRTLRARQAAAP